MWVLIDNYDSFSYILYDYLLRINSSVLVFKSDEINLEELIAIAPTRLIISPGPKSPKEALFSRKVSEHFIGKIPILGVCLGHQILGEILGLVIQKAPYPMHGKTSKCDILSSHTLLRGFSSSPVVMRYHSLIACNWEHNVSITPLLVTCRERVLMMFLSEKLKVCGIQFHPESIGTDNGFLYLENWNNWLKSYGL